MCEKVKANMMRMSMTLLGFLLLISLVMADARRGENMRFRDHMKMGLKHHMLYKDPNQPTNRRIRDLLKRMTLAEKVGQMVQIDRSVATPEIVPNYSIGSLLSGGGSVSHTKATPQEWISMVNSFQNGSLSSRLGIPMIIGIDAVHGHDNVYKATLFPHNIGLGATRDPELVKRIGAATALEV